jgi:hypothetical protein
MSFDSFNGDLASLGELVENMRALRSSSNQGGGSFSSAGLVDWIPESLLKDSAAVAAPAEGAVAKGGAAAAVGSGGGDGADGADLAAAATAAEPPTVCSGGGGANGGAVAAAASAPAALDQATLQLIEQQQRRATLKRDRSLGNRVKEQMRGGLQGLQHLIPDSGRDQPELPDLRDQSFGMGSFTRHMPVPRMKSKDDVFMVSDRVLWVLWCLGTLAFIL